MKTLTTIATATLLMSQAAFAAEGIRTCAASAERDIAENYQARWQQTVREPSAAALAGLYDESAILMPPSDETLVGRTPISDYLSSHAVPASAPNYSVDLVSCERSGNELRVAGVWGLPQTGSAGTTWESGNVLRVLKRDTAGNWVSTYEMWN